MRLLSILFPLAISCSVPAEDEKILDFDALDTEAGIRRAVEDAFPGLSFGFYHWTGTWIMGALEDFDHERILLLLPAEGVGHAKFVRNGERLDLPPGEPVALRCAGALITPEGTVNRPEDAHDHRIGYWVHMRATDRIQIKTKLTYPAKGQFAGTYDPDNGWQTSCAFDVADQDRREPADAYEITRNSLVRRVREVLGTQKECVVRLESRIDIAVRKWLPRDGAEVEPLELRLSDKIILGVGEGTRERTPQELARDLNMYTTAAMAANAAPRVRLHVTSNTDDRVFRATLNALADESFAVAYLAREQEGAEGEPTKPNKSE